MKDKLDKIIWKWILTKGGQPQPASQLATVHQHQLLWDYIFEKESGAYVRANKVLTAIRLRCRSYLKAGVKPTLCSQAAMDELAGHLDVSKVKRLVPPPRKIKTA